MRVKILQKKNEFVENVWPTNSALFIYVSTHCVETVKWLDCRAATIRFDASEIDYRPADAIFDS